MDGLLGHQLICRACLRIVENKTQSFGFIEDANGNLKDMIMCCVPEMDIYVTSNPIMCFPCIQLLVTVYNFKTRCLNTETIIRSYIQRNNLTEYCHVSLSHVVQELIRLNNYFRDSHCRKIEGDKQNMENHPQIPNGTPKIPYGVPQGIPGDQFRPPESQGRVRNQTVPMDYESALGEAPVQGHLEDVRPNGTRSEILKENQFIPMEMHREMPQDIPINSILMQNQNIPSQSKDLSDQETEDQNTPNSERLEELNTQNNQEGFDNFTGQEFYRSEEEKQFNNHENQNEMASYSSEEKTDEKQCEESTTAQSDENIEMPNKAVTSLDVDNSIPSKLDVQKESVTESRPRLIIRICKNKITIPSIKNDNLNEKENEEMDTEIKETEMPLPEMNPFDPYQPQEDDELYQCPNCTFVTTHLNYYITHKNICASELNEKKCPHCPHVTNRQYALNKHINTMHTKSVWYTCDFCPYRSTDSSCLRRHKRNVHPERLGTDLMCRSCSYRCATEYHLKKHMLKHTDNAALQCQFCSYSTRDRSNFRKHVFIHNPTPQGCEFCDYKCVSPYQMKLHLKKAHHGVGMEDIDCKSEVSISEVVQDISAAIREAKCFAGHKTE